MTTSAGAEVVFGPYNFFVKIYPVGEQKNAPSFEGAHYQGFQRLPQFKQ